MALHAWILDQHYGEFALIRKFLIACGYEQANICQVMGHAELHQLQQKPDIVFIDEHHEMFDVATTALPLNAPVILLVDNEHETLHKKVTQLNAQDYLVKPEITLPLFRKCLHYAKERASILQDLERTKNDYLRIFKSHPLPMWIYQRSTLAFIEVNDSAIHNYGYSREEFIQMTIKDIRPLEDIAALINTVNRPYNSGFYDNNHWTHIKKNGELIRVHIYSHNILFRGIESKIVTAVNVSREYELMQQLDELQRQHRQ